LFTADRDSDHHGRVVQQSRDRHLTHVHWRQSPQQYHLPQALGLTAIHVNRVLRTLRERRVVTFRGSGSSAPSTRQSAPPEPSEEVVEGRPESEIF
jgi:hypothetical protein